jgi:hypothetical protein
LALLGLVKLLFDNLLYAWVMAKLKQIAGIEEGDLIALLTGNVLPIGATAVVVWFLYRVAKVHHDKQNLDNTIEFAWDVATGTQVVPSDGKYNRLTLAPIPVERGGGTGISHGPPGYPIFLTGRGYECRITNHSPITIFNATVILESVFLKSADVTQEGAPNLVGKRSGDRLLDRQWTIRVPKLEADAKSPFVLYISNPNDVFVEVRAPDKIRFQRLGSSETEVANLIPSTRQQILFVPPTDFEKRPPELSPLAIVVGEGYAFEKNYSTPQAFVRRLGVALENHHATRTLRNCALTVMEASPPLGWSLPCQVGTPSDIDPGGRQLVVLASYREHGRDSEPSRDTVVTIGDGITVAVAAGLETSMNVRATATDTPASEIRCRVWVDNGKLRIERV